jgi:hypothetical protein
MSWCFLGKMEAWKDEAHGLAERRSQTSKASGVPTSIYLRADCISTSLVLLS